MADGGGKFSDRGRVPETQRGTSTPKVVVEDTFYRLQVATGCKTLPTGQSKTLVVQQ